MDKKTRKVQRESKIWYHRPEMVAPCISSKEMFACATVEMREVRHQQTEYGYLPCELSHIAPVIIATSSIYVSLALHGLVTYQLHRSDEKMPAKRDPDAAALACQREGWLCKSRGHVTGSLHILTCNAMQLSFDSRVAADRSAISPWLLGTYHSRYGQLSRLP